MKQKFTFSSFNGMCDIYVNGKKAYSCHNASHGHIYLPIKGVFVVTAKPHDPRIGIEVEFKDGRIIPFTRPSESIC